MSPAAQDYAPTLGAGISLLNLFGLTSTAARIFAAFIVTFIGGCFCIHFRYPCRSPASLMQAIDQATNLFNKCLDVRAFNEREYGKFTLLLQRFTARASEIAARARPDSTRGESFYREYLEWALFMWQRLRDTVECHRKVRLLIHDLEACLLRSSHSHAEFELHSRLGSSTGLSSAVLYAVRD
ncbi:hypothetical protein L218DRAFT_1009391 [Marasmius fiardii PR-910]|nr:hypothetical protein L218DRAFT_1009391 [Marasmius fiardii PR-910]